jgi:quercetin dioxygenase-like cupin family protein
MEAEANGRPMPETLAETYQPILETLPETAYQKWRKQQGVPVYTGSYVRDLHTAEVAPWSRVGQSGAIVSLADQEKNDGWLIEIQPGGQTETIHHLCEATVYVIEGRGATTVWQAAGSKKQTIEWQAGSLFSPPLNCYYQHFNLDGQRPARVFAATTAPIMMNLTRNPEFLFECPYAFTDRYDAADDYFTNPGQKIGTRRWQTNMVADTLGFKLDRDHRGAGSTNMRFVMASNAMSCHMSEFPTGTYKKAHRHGAGAEIIILNGTGYSLLWFAGGEPLKVDWQEGSLFSPRGDEYHQHFNTGKTPARYLAYTFGNLVVEDIHATRGAEVSEREGGWQIEYEDEDPEIYALFERECAKHGAAVTLPRASRV